MRHKNEWVGEYQMGEGRKLEHPRNMSELAQANSYTYTLQQPIQSQPKNTDPRQHRSNNPHYLQSEQRHFQTFQEAENESDESSESDLSEYSPNAEMKGFFQHEYQMNSHPQEIYPQQQ